MIEKKNILLSFVVVIFFAIAGGIISSLPNSMIEKNILANIFFILVGTFLLVTRGKQYYKGAVKRDLKFNVMGGKRWIGTPALIIGLFNLLLAVLLIIIPLYFIIRNMF